MKWQGVIAYEGRPTGDGRMIAPGAVEWNTPVPLHDEDGNPIGHVTQIWVVGGGQVRAEGIITEMGARGVGVDLTVERFGYSFASDTATIEKGTLRAVSITGDPAWPDAGIWKVV